MLPFLILAVIFVGLPTIYFAFKSREYRKFLAGAFFVSGGMQIYFYQVQISIPLLGSSAVQGPELSLLRGALHLLLCLVCIYFGWFRSTSANTES